MRLAIAAVVALALAVALAAQAPQTSTPLQRPATPQQPTFKAGVNFVRVDVYPTVNGQIVPDLKRDEFEVLEDGVPQRIETFERVVIRAPGAEVERAEPRSVAESDQAAADARNRLFILFLDSYHTSIDAPTNTAAERVAAGGTSAEQAQRNSAGDSRVGRSLVTFLDRLIGPDDLLAVMRPEMPVDTLNFTRRPSSFEQLLLAGEWQRRGARGDLDNVEREYQACYPNQPDLVGKMIARRRERLVIGALHNLVIHLQGLREERKAILVVSEGWWLFKPDSTMTAMPQGGGIGPPPIGIAGGQPVLGDPHDAAPYASCDRDRLMLADIDDAREFRDMLNEANRSNASFYPIAPWGRTTPGPPPASTLNLASMLSAELSPMRDAESRRTGLDTLQTLASATDGIAIVGSDTASNLRRISDDLSSYYLLGYNSTNAKFDGKFRKIAVRVKRPGVSVRARSGYAAPTEAEIAARAKAPAPRDPEEDLRGSALSSLGTERPDRPLRITAGYGFDAPTSEGQARRLVLWIIGELDLAAARTMEWSGGADATIAVSDANGQPVATERATFGVAAPRFIVRVSDAGLKPGDYLVKVRLQGKAGGTADASDQVRITLPDLSGAAAPVLGQPLLFRRGPYTGPGFQPTADLRFRKPERIRVDVPVAVASESVGAQLLDRKGQPLPIPVTTGQREDGTRRFVTAEITLAPLAPGDYLVEVSVRRGDRTDKVVTAFRIVP